LIEKAFVISEWVCMLMLALSSIVVVVVSSSLGPLSRERGEFSVVVVVMVILHSSFVFIMGMVLVHILRFSKFYLHAEALSLFINCCREVYFWHVVDLSFTPMFRGGENLRLERRLSDFGFCFYFHLFLLCVWFLYFGNLLDWVYLLGFGFII